jgi:PAS domain S-box-containing protein
MENQEFYSQIIQEAPFAYSHQQIILDDDGKPVDYRFLDINPAFERLTGLKKDVLIGHTVGELLPGIKEDEFDWIGQYGKIALEGGKAEIEQYSEALGKWYKIQVLSTEKGFFTTFFVDVTERNFLEQDRQHQIRLRELLMEISSGFIHIPLEEVDESVNNALKTMALFVNADRSYTFDYDWEQRVCNNIHEWCADGVSPEIDNLQRVPLDMMPDWVEAHKNGEPMYVPDVFALPLGNVREILEPQGIKSVLAVPMMDEGLCMGFVGFDSVKDHHNYSNTEQQLLKLFALSLTHVKRRKKMLQELIDAKEIAEANEKYFRSIFHESPVLFWEEDFSQAKHYFEVLKNQGITNFGAWFDQHPEEIGTCAHMISITDVNDAVLKTLQYPDKETLLENFHHTLTPVSLNEFRNALINLAEDINHFECVTEHRTRNGEVKQFFLKSFVSNTKRDFSRVLVAMIDISELKNKERELIAAKERAEESDHLKTAFLQNLSHEIRTPLNGIIGFSGLLKDTSATTPVQKKYIDIIIERGWQLTAIIDDILTISSLETKQEQLYNEVFNLPEMLQNHLAVFESQAARNGNRIVLNYRLPGNQPEISADKTKLGQVLNNLFTNAIKFTKNGIIELDCQLQEGMIRFCVRDTGIGIAPSKLELIFERFAQADDTIRRLYGGTGLGLSICRGFVEMMGGEIRVESEVGKGSSFIFTIPWIPVKQPDDHAAHDHKIIRSDRPLTMLVAEDEETNFTLLNDILVKMNIKVLHVSNGLQAVETCRNAEVDMVLMDIKMPVMNGYEAALEIRKIMPAIPIVAQTAYADQSEIARYHHAFDDYITKPFTKEKLIRVIGQFLGK